MDFTKNKIVNIEVKGLEEKSRNIDNIICGVQALERRKNIVTISFFIATLIGIRIFYPIYFRLKITPFTLVKVLLLYIFLATILFLTTRLFSKFLRLTKNNLIVNLLLLAITILGFLLYELNGWGLFGSTYRLISIHGLNSIINLPLGILEVMKSYGVANPMIIELTAIILFIITVVYRAKPFESFIRVGILFLSHILLLDIALNKSGLSNEMVVFILNLLVMSSCFTYIINLSNKRVK